MTDLRFYGKPPPGTSTDPLPGRLVVIEGVDGVGRTTQIALLSEWLELRGHAVLTSGLTRSRLAGRGIERAKEGNTLDRLPSTCSMPQTSVIGWSGKSSLHCGRAQLL